METIMTSNPDVLLDAVEFLLAHVSGNAGPGATQAAAENHLRAVQKLHAELNADEAKRVPAPADPPKLKPADTVIDPKIRLAPAPKVVVPPVHPETVMDNLESKLAGTEHPQASD
jgi:hypothetical protein